MNMPLKNTVKKVMKGKGLDLSIHKNLLSRIRIPHPAFELGLKELQLSFDSVGITDFPQCLHFVGTSRAGKTCLVKEFRKRYPATRNDEGVYMPVVYTEVPPTGTILGMLENILLALGDPNWSRGAISNKLARVKEQLEKCSCRMLIIDELQHLVDKGQNLKLKQTRDWLKSIAEANQWALVVCGLETSRAVIMQDKQLKGRFDTEIEIPRFEWDDEELHKQFLSVLGGFQVGLAPFSLPNMQDENMALRFYLASGGLIGYVVKLLQRAVINAIAEKRTTIGLPELETAFRRVVSFASGIPSGQGPFESKTMDIKMPDRREEVVKLATAVEEPVKERARRTSNKAEMAAQNGAPDSKAEHNRKMSEAFR